MRHQKCKEGVAFVMEEYENLEIEVIEFANEDVITTSYGDINTDIVP